MTLPAVANLPYLFGSRTALSELSEPSEQITSPTACSNQAHIRQTKDLLCPLHQLKRFQ